MIFNCLAYKQRSVVVIMVENSEMCKKRKTLFKSLLYHIWYLNLNTSIFDNLLVDYWMEVDGPHP